MKLKVPQSRISSSTVKAASNSFLPNASTSSSLVVTGATLGPVVDSLHNQCLLLYDVAPIGITSTAGNTIFYSSWIVPPLLGFAYLVLGGILPRALNKLLPATTSISSGAKMSVPSIATTTLLRSRAILAVLSTACIIRTSEILETTSTNVLEKLGIDMTVAVSTEHIIILSVLVILQWVLLDRTVAGLLLASAAFVGGPLSEIPFISLAHAWHYIAPDTHYALLGNDIGLASITGPCYFAVAMDAIALGRWFESREGDF